MGLGLPEYQPGLADRNLMHEATLASERQHIEDAMLKDKMKMTDWERTEEELSRQIANESYVDYLRGLEAQGAKKSAEHARKSPSRDKHAAVQSKGQRGRSSKQKSPMPVAEECKSKSIPVRFGLGSKRGASSPNLPATGTDDGHRLAKIHRNGELPVRRR